MSYVKNIWENGDVITAAKLNNIENGIKNNDTAVSKLAVLPLALTLDVSEDPVLTADVSAGDIAELVDNGVYPLFLVSNGAGTYTGLSEFLISVDSGEGTVAIELVAGTQSYECQTTLASTDHAVFTPVD